MSPIREGDEDALGELDELSIASGERSTARTVRKEMSEPLQETPAAAKARRSIRAVSATPATIVARRNIDRSASSNRSKRSRTTPVIDQEEDEDELHTPQPITATPIPISRARSSQRSPEGQEEMDVDELSPQVRPSTLETDPAAVSNSSSEQKSNARQSRGPHAVTKTTRSRNSTLLAEEDEEDVVQSTPVISKPRRIRNEAARIEESHDDEEPDELSPERPPPRPSITKPAFLGSNAVHLSASPNRQSPPEQDEESPEPSSRRPIPQDTQSRPSQPQKQRMKPAADKPRKRPKLDGPIQTIQVMRLKGTRVKGYTVADTTRTAIEEYIDDRVSLLSKRFQGTEDLTHRKQIKSRINLQLSFKEALSERMMDLQDLNDCFTIRAQKLKAFKRRNAELRKEILATQTSRQEIAIEYDNVLTEFELEKEAFEAQNTLSTAMFDIQAAIAHGREKAIDEHREDEGPELPTSMLLDTVSRNVGSVGGGFLQGVRSFNAVLENAAMILEGRA